MGGKNKQSQRTKNNVRPSSSSRSAELLTNTAGGLAPFAAAAASGKPFPTIFPTLKAAVETEQALNADFMLSVKKLNKKDPITKVKALGELTDLVKKSEVDDVVTFLPVWTRIFGQLALDPDHKVRESVQICHGSIVQSCGRRMCPQLRALLPAWVCGARDDHPPAAAAADYSLQSTFPEAKLPEVIAYCKEEMMNFYTENLTGDLDAILANRSLSPEAMSQHRTRIILGSLQGVQYVGEILPRPHDDWLQTKLQHLYGDKKFWQLANHEDIRLRSCWFICMSRLIPRGQPKPVLAKLLGVSLEAAKQQDALLSPQVWTCLLLVMTTDKDWYSHIKNKKEFVNRVFDIISNGKVSGVSGSDGTDHGGGWGDARKLCDIILPLLAHLPQEILDQTFYQKFFDALIKGLHKKSILNSKSERQSWITSIGECFRYLSLQNADYTIDVATYTHRAWLEALLNISQDSNVKNHLIKASAINMTSILKYWMKQTENLDKFDSLVRNLWQNLCSTVLKEIDNLPLNDDDISNAIASHTILIQSIQNSFIQEARVKKCIRFDVDAVEQPAATSERNEQCTDDIKERFNHNLKEFAFNVCCRYFQFARDNTRCELVLNELMTLIRAFDCKELFESIANHFEDGSRSVISLYRNVLMQWLMDDKLTCEVLVQLVFMVMKYLSESDQEAVFESFNGVSARVVEWCVRGALGVCAGAGVGGAGAGGVGVCAGAGAGGAVRARGWVSGRAARGGVRALCLRADACLLAHAHAHAHSHDSILPPAAIEEMLSAFTDALHHGEGEELETRASHAARLVSVLADDDGSRCEKLMMKLFALLFENQLGKGVLTTETWHEVQSACEDVVRALPDSRYSCVLADCTSMLHGKLLDRKQEFHIDQIDHLASIFPIFIKKSTTDAELIENIENLTKILYDFNVDTDSVQYYTLRLDVITFKLNCLFEDDNKFIKKVIETSADNDESELSSVDLILHANKILFRAAFLKNILKSMEEDGENMQCNVLMQNTFGVKELSEILHEYVIFQSLFEGYAFWEHYDIIEQSKKRLEFLLEEILAMTSHQTRNVIGQYLTEQCNLFGYYWAYALRCFKDKCESISPVQALVDNKEKTDSTDPSVVSADLIVEESGTRIDKLNLNDDDVSLTGNGYFHYMQAKSNKSDEYNVKLHCQIMIRCLTTAFPAEAKEILLEHSGHEMDAVVNAYFKYNYIMLYERSLVTADYQQVVANAAILQYLSHLVSTSGWEASEAHWDFTTIALCSLGSSLKLDKAHWGTTKVGLIARPLLELVSVSSRFISLVPARSLACVPLAHVASLPREWRDIFAPEVYGFLLQLIMQIAASPRSMCLSAPQCVLLRSLSTALPLFAAPPTPFSGQLLAALCDCASRLLAAAAAAAAHHAYVYLAYYLLRNLRDELLRNDAESVQRWSESPESADKAPPQIFLHHFTETFKHLNQIVGDSLEHVKVGAGVCVVSARAALCSVWRAALCVHAAALHVWTCASRDLPAHYRAYYTEHELGGEILSIAFKLLPSLDPKELAAYSHAFDNMPDFDLSAAPRAEEVYALACYTVRAGVSACAGAAAALAAAPQAALLHRVLRETVCPREIQRQLSLVQSQRHLLPDTEITIHWSTREVECVHRIEERSVRLSVGLSAMHPLQPPAVQSDHFNVTWLIVYIAYQNGSLFEGISMWTKMVQSRVESAPQCYICYCRLHPSKGTLPKASCHTCHNKFHADCLQKWFTTSKKSSCPLCRAEFI